MANLKTLLNKIFSPLRANRKELFFFKSILMQLYRRDIGRPIYRRCRKLRLNKLFSLWFASWLFWVLYGVAICAILSRIDISTVIVTFINSFLFSVIGFMIHRTNKARRGLIFDRIALLKDVRKDSYKTLYIITDPRAKERNEAFEKRLIKIIKACDNEILKLKKMI